jgi:hypothetical protein
VKAGRDLELIEDENRAFLGGIRPEGPCALRSGLRMSFLIGLAWTVGRELIKGGNLAFWGASPQTPRTRLLEHSYECCNGFSLELAKQAIEDVNRLLWEVYLLVRQTKAFGGTQTYEGPSVPGGPGGIPPRDAPFSPLIAREASYGRYRRHSETSASIIG